MNIQELVAGSHSTAVDKGWWDQPREVLEQLMLMVTELAEAAEDWRAPQPNYSIKDIQYWSKDGNVYPSQNEEGTLKPCGFAIELADCVIRIADTCGKYGIDLDEALRVKMAYNRTRPYRHGGKLA